MEEIKESSEAEIVFGLVGMKLVWLSIDGMKVQHVDLGVLARGANSRQ